MVGSSSNRGPADSCVPPGARPPAPAAREAAAWLLREAYAAGLTRLGVLGELEEIVSVGKRAEMCTVSLYEPRPGLRALLKAELEAACRIGVRPLGSLRAARPGSPVIVRYELLARLRRARTVECLPVALAGGTRERDLVRRRARRGLVVLLSRSRTIRVFAAELAAGEFGSGVSFAAFDGVRDRRSAARALAAAKFIFHDRLLKRHAYSAAAPAAPITLVPPRETRRLRQYLGVAARK